MKREEISAVVSAQREYFGSGATLGIKARIDALKRLRAAISANEAAINEALRADLGKSDCESYMCEVGLVLGEIGYMLRHIRKFARDKRVRTPIAQFAAKSYVKKSPFGTVLIMSPWNYPFLLSISPLVDAIAAGNTAVIKPSAYSPHTSDVIARLLGDVFDRRFVAVIGGGREENSFLLDEKFDYIFFTGSKAVGKLVMRKASEHLTPVTLELGGKSPCIVDKSADIPLCAKRLVFGKFLNLGQTCVAPDYVFCHKSVKARLIDCIRKEISAQFGDCPLDNPNYGKIVNRKHFDRILALIDGEKVVIGGGFDERKLKIEPTVLDNVDFCDAVMGEEIFGPVLPILTFEDIGEVVGYVNGNPSPLAFYIFAENRDLVRFLTERCRFGGGCVNDVVIHLATSYMGFGGVGESGMGAYHGKSGFDTFSHSKNIVDKKTFIDLSMRYQPYSRLKQALIRIFLK